VLISRSITLPIVGAGAGVAAGLAAACPRAPVAMASADMKQSARRFFIDSPLLLIELLIVEFMDR
jgi:hypothetical protein